jgi:hypothetical protein
MISVEIMNKIIFHQLCRVITLIDKMVFIATLIIILLYQSSTNKQKDKSSKKIIILEICLILLIDKEIQY